jgi:hypothetical protein
VLQPPTLTFDKVEKAEPTASQMDSTQVWEKCWETKNWKHRHALNINN